MTTTTKEYNEFFLQTNKSINTQVVATHLARTSYNLWPIIYFPNVTFEPFILIITLICTPTQYIALKDTIAIYWVGVQIKVIIRMNGSKVTLEK